MQDAGCRVQRVGLAVRAASRVAAEVTACLPPQHVICSYLASIATTPVALEVRNLPWAAEYDASGVASLRSSRDERSHEPESTGLRRALSGVVPTSICIGLSEVCQALSAGAGRRADAFSQTDRADAISKNCI